MSSSLDKLYSENLDQISDFVFDKNVAAVFDNMVNRSVPLYTQVQAITAELCFRFAKPGSAVYDLGCSSGTTLALIAKRLSDASVAVYGVDNSAPMLGECKKKLAHMGLLELVTLLEGDVRDCELKPSSVIILNYTLQFIPPDDRIAALTRIHRHLLPGGILLVSEKVEHRGEKLGGVIRDMHHDFKKENGYSQLEISQKREALENVLQPLTGEANLSLLREAGFAEVELYAKSFNFASFVALRT